jgi:Flp pilus assembly protein TadB
MNPYQEFGKMIGAVVWIVGVVMLFVQPVAGMVVLLAALALSVRSVQKTRERRHREMLDATRNQPGQ